MSAFHLIVYFISILGMSLIATMTVIGSRGLSRVVFAISIYLDVVWLLIQLLMQMLNLNGSSGLLMAQIASSMSMTMAISFYFFIRTYLEKPINIKFTIISILVIALSFFMNISGLTIKEAYGNSDGIIISNATSLYNVYVIIVGLIFVLSIIELLRYSKDLSRKNKIRNRIMTIGFMQSVIFLVASNTFLQSSSESQIIMPVSMLVMSVLVSLAIIKYSFFDIKAAVIRATTYVLSLLTLSALYYGVAYVLSIFLFKDNVSSSFSASPMNIALALVLAFVFQPIKRFFDKYTNRFFYKDNYNTDDFFARLNKTLSSTIDLRDLLECAAVEIGQTLKGEQAFFFIYTNDGHYISAGTQKHKQLPKSDADQICLMPKTADGVIMTSMLNEADPMRRLMLSHRLELVLPLFKDKKQIGFFCLGEHKISHYTSRDIKVLNTISNELIIAIQNALAVQEIREFNTTLKQQIANATAELRTSNSMLRRLDKAKDEFVGMASHQLRTPLTSVKGYISMVLEGDAGKVSESQKQLLNEAFNSSERMVGLINDFLNVSRIQTGKFVIDKHEVDLSKLIAQEVDSLQASATAHNLKLFYDAPKDDLNIEIDEGKIQQVVMNFIDNAIYYSRVNTSINVQLSVENGKAIFTVKDSGIGVPVEERDELFTKFFRASNAKVQRPDGTGVGLYLAKKIILAHDGKLIFESVQDKGSTFGFSLPIVDKTKN